MQTYVMLLASGGNSFTIRSALYPAKRPPSLFPCLCGTQMHKCSQIKLDYTLHVSYLAYNCPSGHASEFNSNGSSQIEYKYSAATLLL